MHPRPTRPAALAALALVVLLAACGSTPGAPTNNPTNASSGAIGSLPASLGPRPSSPATVAIVQPATGAVITGNTVHVVLKLTGATIVAQTSTDIRPDQGHVHLYVDNVLFSMNYGLEQDLPVHPGTYVLKAEFVAADHAPFSPRVYSPEVFFTVN